jgi:cytochrome b
MTTIDNVPQTPAVEQHTVWDLPVRVFHWTLVAAIIGAFVTNRLGVSYFKYHVWCGYTVIVLVVFRVVWGFVGTRHAQFWNFVCGPAATLRYAIGLLRGHELRYAGHNPLGAWMVLALLFALGLQASLGLFSNDEIFNVGPLYGYVSKDLSLQLTSLHRYLFYWILGAIAIHVLAVMAHHVFEKANLLHAMITGRKPHHAVAETDGIASSRTWLAVLLIVVLAGALAWVVRHAPVPVEDTLY